MKHALNFSTILGQKLASLETHRQTAIFERDNSATPTESHSDKTRQLAEQLIDALSDEKKKLLLLKTRIKFYRPTFFHLSSPQGERALALVPEGLGGEVHDGLTFLSENSPLGIKLSRSKAGDKIILNATEFTILSKN